MDEHPHLVLRARPPISRKHTTGAIILTQLNLVDSEAAMIVIPPVNMSPSKTRHPSSLLPPSVPKAPRSMLKGEVLTTTKAVSPRHAAIPPSSDNHLDQISSKLGKSPQTNYQDCLHTNIYSSRGMLIKEPVHTEHEHCGLEIRLKPDVKPLKTGQSLLPLQTKIRCWICLKDGHDMIGCKTECAHCKATDHNSIACRYRTFHKSTEAGVGADSKSEAVYDAAQTITDQNQTGNPKQTFGVCKQEKGKLEETKQLKKLEILERPKKVQVPNGPKLDPYTSRKKSGQSKVGEFKRGRRLVREPDRDEQERQDRRRSCSPRLHRGRHLAGGRHPSHRDRGYRVRDYSPRRAMNDHDQSQMGNAPRMNAVQRGRPYENGKGNGDPRHQRKYPEKTCPGCPERQTGQRYMHDDPHDSKPRWSERSY